MKLNLTHYLKIIVADRLMVVLISLLVILSLVYCGYVIISLHPSDLQVAVHYTAFGGANFYREKWYYLLSFVVFGLVVAVVHSLLAVKIYTQERRQLAIAFLLLSVLMIVIAWAIAHMVLGIAFL